MNIEERKAARFKYLRVVHDITKGNPLGWVERNYVAEQAGIERDDADAAMEFLIHQGLLKHAGSGRVGITHEGVLEIERALTTPSEPTTYFPPVVNIINVGRDMVGSSVQQAGAGSTQSTAFDTSGIRQFLQAAREKIDELDLDAVQKVNFAADLTTAEAQLQKTAPSRAILGESLRSVRTILEGVAANVVASGLLEMLTKL